jgi:hypothetical protein
MDNLYGYVNNNPVNYTDITGLWSGCEVVGAWAMANWGKPTAWSNSIIYRNGNLIISLPWLNERYRVIPVSLVSQITQVQYGLSIRFCSPIISISYIFETPWIIIYPED